MNGDDCDEEEEKTKKTQTKHVENVTSIVIAGCYLAYGLRVFSLCASVSVSISISLLYSHCYDITVARSGRNLFSEFFLSFSVWSSLSFLLLQSQSRIDHTFHLSHAVLVWRALFALGYCYSRRRRRMFSFWFSQSVNEFFIILIWDNHHIYRVIRQIAQCSTHQQTIWTRFLDFYKICDII